MLKNVFNAAALYAASVPYLLDLLYDVDLLPEQCDTNRAKICMIAVVEAYQKGLSVTDV